MASIEYFNEHLASKIFKSTCMGKYVTGRSLRRRKARENAKVAKNILEVKVLK